MFNAISSVTYPTVTVACLLTVLPTPKTNNVGVECKVIEL